MLAFELELLTGRYAAARHNDRDRAEWPPHPARVYASLVATYHDADDPDDAEREALEWLAEQAAPGVACSEASQRSVTPVFVPVNDTSLFANLGEKELEAERARALAAGPHPDAKAAKAATKSLEKAERALTTSWDRQRKAAMEPGPLAAKAITDGAGLLPERRLRKERTFPVAVPEKPVVHLVWADAEPSERVRAALGRLCERVVRVGHSSSLVRLGLCEAPPEVKWRPDAAGSLMLRVPQPGQLALLEQAYERHRETEARILPFDVVTYGGARAVSTSSVGAPLLSGEWVVFRRMAGRWLDLRASARVADALRGALQAHAAEPIHPALSGHQADGRPLDQAHVAFVPLPHVGWSHADGAIMGVAVLLPRDLDEDGRLAVYDAIGSWERAAARAGGRPTLTLGRAGALELERLEGPPDVRALDRATWRGPSRLWVSATPVALDRHPGALFSDDPAKADRAEEEAEATVVRACRNVGLPEPARVRVLRTEILRGSVPAREFPPFPAQRKGPRRLLVHFRLRFEEPVTGPVLLGAGRYRGLGLFRPIPEDRR